MEAREKRNQSTFDRFGISTMHGETGSILVQKFTSRVWPLLYMP